MIMPCLGQDHGAACAHLLYGLTLSGKFQAALDTQLPGILVRPFVVNSEWLDTRPF